MPADATEDDEALEITRTVDPLRPGYMTIAGAAIWIATRGLQIDVDPDDAIAMTAALREIIDHAASGDMKVMGSIPDGLVSECVPSNLFISCPIAYLPGIDAEEIASGDRIALRSWAFESDHDWENGFDDALARGGEIYWEKLRVNRVDVARLWPFGQAAANAHETMTGEQGRPSKSAHLIVAEHKRRCAEGQALETLAAEARYLVDWLPRAHPCWPVPTEKTVKNRLRAAHRRYLEARN